MRRHDDAPVVLVQVLADPGKTVARHHDLGPDGDESETVPSWQARALIAAGLVLPSTILAATP